MKKHSKTIIKGTSYMFIGKMAYTVSLFFINFILGRLLGPSKLGTFSLVKTIFQVFTFISLFGFYNTINRFSPEYKELRQKNKLNALAGTTLKFTFILSIFSIVTVNLSSNFLASQFKDLLFEKMIRIFIIGLPFYVISRILIAFTTSFHTTKFEALIENTLVPLTQTLILFINLKIGLDWVGIPIAYLFGYIIGFVASVITGKFSRINTINYRKAFKLFEQKYIFYSIPIFLHNTILFLIRWIDTLILGIFSTSKKIGIYSVVLNITNIPAIILTATNTIFFPIISGFLAQKKWHLVKETYSKVINILTLIVLPITILTINFGTNIVKVFGNEFSASTLLIAILATGVFFNVFSGPIDYTLNAIDRPKLILINSTVALIVNLTLNLILIPKYDIIGAAIANSTSIIVQNYLGIAELYLIKKFIPYQKSNLKLIFVSLFVNIPIFLITRYFIDLNYNNIFTIVKIALLSLGYIFLYIQFIIVFKILDKQEINLIKKILIKFKNGTVRKSKR